MADKNFEVRKGLTVANTVIVTSGANVGIGNTAPEHTLSVNGNIYVNTSITINSSNVIANTIGVFTTGTVNGTVLSVGSSVLANTSRLVLGTAVGLQANGGIGTVGQVLHSNGTTIYWRTINSGNGIISNSSGLYFIPNTGIVANTSGVFVNAAYINTISSNSATFANSSVTNTFTVGTGSYFVANGNVGIGTNTPEVKLKVQGDLTVSANIAFDGALVVDGTPGSTNDLLISNGSSGAYWGSLVSSGLIPSEYVREDENTVFTGNNSFTGANTSFTGSNVLVSGTNLNVSSNVTVSGNLSVARITTSQNVTTLGTVVYVTTTGNVGISNSTPIHKLRVQGTTSLGGAVSDITTLSAGNTTITGFANATVSVNSALLTVGSSFIANTTGAYHTGTINAASHTVGTSTVANSTGVYTGVVNGSSITVGTNTIANSSGLFTTGTVNALVLSVGTAFISNSLGVYHIGTVNAQSITVGSSIVANTSRLALGPTVGLQANGGIGTAGQVLHSNGTTIYWDTDDQGVTSVATGNGLTGGTITSIGTISVIPGNGLVAANSTGVHVGAGSGITVNTTAVAVNPGNGLVAANSTGVHVGAGSGITVNTTAVAVLPNTGIVANATGVYVNSAFINTIASNSATYANASISNTFTVGTSAYFVANGNLGIGTTAPSFRLHVKGTGASQYYVSEDGVGYSIYGMDGSGGAVIGTFTTGVPLAVYSNSTPRVFVAANGNVGIGTNYITPTATLDVSGSVSIAKANVQSQTLTDAATISWNTALGQIATVTLAGNRTFDGPTNLKIGTYVLNIIQDGVGGRTGDFSNTIFKFPGGVDPILTTTANARDIIFFYSDGTNMYGSFLPDVK